jgi:hypothetical protein
VLAIDLQPEVDWAEAACPRDAWACSPGGGALQPGFGTVNRTVPGSAQSNVLCRVQHNQQTALRNSVNQPAEHAQCTWCCCALAAQWVCEARQDLAAYLAQLAGSLVCGAFGWLEAGAVLLAPSRGVKGRQVFVVVLVPLRPVSADSMPQFLVFLDSCGATCASSQHTPAPICAAT